MFLLFFFSMCMITSLSAGEFETLQAANQSYTTGEQAQTLAKRQEDFNRAMTLYAILERDHRFFDDNGILDFKIANTYYQLEQYPWAVLYYYRAMNAMPRNNEVKVNLELALHQLGIVPQQEQSIFRKVFFLNTYWSLLERLYLFFGLFVIALAVTSLYIWRVIAVKQAVIFVWILCGVILTSIGYTFYFTPVKAVVVESSLLYRSAGEEYAAVSEQPILSGEQVQVVEVLKEGTWLKVITGDKTLGYLSARKIRII